MSTGVGSALDEVRKAHVIQRGSADRLGRAASDATARRLEEKADECRRLGTLAGSIHCMSDPVPCEDAEQQTLEESTVYDVKDTRSAYQ